MDLEKISHQNYRISVWVAIVLSGIVVTLAAFLGRGALNLKAALVLEEPTDVTVIALMEPKLPADAKIVAIDFLRKEPDPNSEKPTYAYHIETSDRNNYFLRLYFNREIGQWEVTRLETLHATPEGETPALR